MKSRNEVGSDTILPGDVYLEGGSTGSRHQPVDRRRTRPPYSPGDRSQHPVGTYNNH